MKVLLPAQVRWDGRWIAASVRNLSSRGLMICSTQPPPPGTYVEIQIGSEVITARAMWTKEQACGLQSRNKLDVARLSSPRGTVRDKAGINANATFRPSRSPTQASIHSNTERSKYFSTLLQYGMAFAVALLAAGSLGWEVYHTLSAPLKTVEAKLVQEP